MNVLQHLRYWTLQKFRNNLFLTFILSLNVRTLKYFSIILTKILALLTMEEESNGELAFLGTLLKRNNGEISVFLYRKSTHADQYLHYSFHHQTSWKESVVYRLFSRAYSIITNKDGLHKENTRIKQVLRENWYQESIISKTFKRITNKNSLPQSQQLMQATDIQEEEIRVSMNLPYIGGTSEKLQRIPRSHRIRSTFYTENTLRKLFCKPKNWVATEDKNNFFYEIGCSNCEAVYFGKIAFRWTQKIC